MNEQATRMITIPIERFEELVYLEGRVEAVIDYLKPKYVNVEAKDVLHMLNCPEKFEK